MKIERLEVSGLRSHRGNPATCLDLADKRLVAIVGHTGAGKSSLLEAVTFALFGEATYGGKAYEELSSDGRTEMSVRMAFTVGDGRYQLARTVRPNRNGDFGSKEIYLRRVDDEGNVLSHVDGVRKVDDTVSKLLGGISREQFCQSVLLAQNRFAAFLEADPRERDALLDTLLGLTALQDARKALLTIRKAVQRNVERLTDRREHLPADPAAEAREAKRRAQTMSTVAKRAAEGAERLGTLSGRAATLTRDAHELTAAAALRATAAGPEGLARLTVAMTTVTGLMTTDEGLRKRERKASGDLENARDLLRQATEALTTAETEHGHRGEHPVVAEQLRQLEELVAQIPNRERESSNSEAAVTGCRGELEQAQSAAATAKSVADAQRENVRRAEEEAAAKRNAVSDAEQALGKASDIVARLRAQEALVDTAKGDLATADAQVAQANDELGPTAERRDQARRALELVQRADAAASAAHGCQPGEGCPVCARPLPDGWTPPVSGDLDDAKTTMRDVDAECEAATSKQRETGEHRAGVASRLRSALANFTATLDELVKFAEHCDFTPPCSGATVLKPGEDESAALGEAAGAAHALGSEVATWLKSLDATTAPLRKAREDADVVLQEARDVLRAAEASHADASTSVNDANLALAAAVSTHDACVRAMKDARTLLATTLDAVDKRWRTGIDPAEPQSLVSTTTRLAEDQATVEAADQAHTNAATAVTAAERALEGLSRERAEKVAAPLASVTATLIDLVGLVNDLATRVDVSPAPSIAEAPTPAELRDATSALKATAAAAAEAAAARAETLRTEVTGLVAPAAEVVTSLVDLLAEVDPTGTDIGAAPDPQDPLAPGTYARVQQIVGGARQLAREATTASLQAKEAVKAAKDLDQRLAALAAWRADLDGAVGVLKKEAFPTWARNVRIADLVDTASELFSEMTSGRYRFDETLRISDEQAGVNRNASTLSGGEKFEAALALALGVAEIAGRSGVRIDTLFLDEGFAGLDQAHLNRTIDALESQVEAGRCIVLITHIGSVADRIQDVLLVQPDGLGGSSMRWLNEEERFELGADLDLAVP